MRMRLNDAKNRTKAKRGAAAKRNRKTEKTKRNITSRGRALSDEDTSLARQNR